MITAWFDGGLAFHIPFPRSSTLFHLVRRWNVH